MFRSVPHYVTSPKPRLALVLLMFVAACDTGDFQPQPPLQQTEPTVTKPASVPTAPIPSPAEPGTDQKPIGSASNSATPKTPPPIPLQLDGELKPRPAQPIEDNSRLVVEATWTWPKKPRADPSANDKALEMARAATAADWRIELLRGSRGRMRITLPTDAFILEKNTELIALEEHYGLVVKWPKAAKYRTLAAGTIKPLLDEGRADSVPTLDGVASKGRTSKRLGKPTTMWSLRSNLGEIQLELARVADAQRSGPLLCRALLELGGLSPSHPVCENGTIPLRARYYWGTGKERQPGARFDVRQMQSSPAPPNEVNVELPDANAKRTTTGLPTRRNPIFVSKAIRAEWRTPAIMDPDPTILYNGSDRPLYLTLDGVAFAWVLPRKERKLNGLPRGRYVVQWRSFIGDVLSESTQMTLPGNVEHGPPRQSRAPSPANDARQGPSGQRRQKPTK